MTVKHSVENPVLLNFVHLSTTFSPKLCLETDFHFSLVPDPLI